MTFFILIPGATGGGGPSPIQYFEEFTVTLEEAESLAVVVEETEELVVAVEEAA